MPTLKPGICCLFLLLTAGTATAASEDYATLLGRLQSGQTDVDYKALRMGYAASPGYAPNQLGSLNSRRAVEKALKAEDYQGAVPLLEAWLKADYLNPFAHLGASRAYARTGDATRARFHDAVVDGMFRSICAQDEGRADTRPCKVVSIDEELFTLAMNGLKIEGQHGQLCPGEVPCNVYDVIEPKSGKRQVLYFDISLPLGYLEKQRGPVTAPPPPAVEPQAGGKPGQ